MSFGYALRQKWGTPTREDMTVKAMTWQDWYAYQMENASQFCTVYDLLEADNLEMTTRPTRGTSEIPWEHRRRELDL